MAEESRNALFAYRNAVRAPWIEAESATSHTLDAGTKVFYVPGGTRFYKFGLVDIYRTSDRAKRMRAAILSFDRTTGRCEVLVSLVWGSGTHSDWTIRLAKYRGGSWYESLPLAQLDDLLLYEFARSIGAEHAATRFWVDLGRQSLVDLFCILRSNIEPEAKFRLRLVDVAANTGAVTVQADTTKQDCWQPTEKYGTKRWGAFRWNGKTVLPGGRTQPYIFREQLSVKSRTEVTIASGLRRQAVTFVTDGPTTGFYLNQRVTVAGDGDPFVGLMGIVDVLAANKITVWVTDVEGLAGESLNASPVLTRQDWTIRGIAADAPRASCQARFAVIDLYDQPNDAGFIDIGGMMLSPIFQSRINIEAGSDEIGFLDPSPRWRSTGGQLHGIARSKIPRLAFTLPALEPSEAFATVLLEIQSGLGTVAPMLVMVDPGDSENALAQTIYGPLTALAPMRGVFQEIKSWNVEIEGYD